MNVPENRLRTNGNGMWQKYSTPLSSEYSYSKYLEDKDMRYLFGYSNLTTLLTSCDQCECHSFTEQGAQHYHDKSLVECLS